MAGNTKIEWCDHTVNLWWGCSKVHTGCKNCYAETLSKRFDNNIWGKDKNRKRIKSAFKDLDKYQKQAEKLNKKVTVFVGSMMDIFEESKTLTNPNSQLLYEKTNNLRLSLFYKINRGEYSNIIFLFLTKRPENIYKMILPSWKNNVPKNVWFGFSASNQKTFDKYLSIIDKAKGIENVKKFISIEPQTEIIVPKGFDLNRVNWVIQGCESGTNARPFNIYWANKIKDACKKAGTPYFLKQIQDEKGKLIKDINRFPNVLKIREFPVW